MDKKPFGDTDLGQGLAIGFMLLSFLLGIGGCCRLIAS